MPVPRAPWRASLAVLAATAPVPAWTQAPAPPPLLLAEVLGPEVDVSRYLVSEKYDGVRAVWDGKELRFRSGREVAAPRWFKERLPTQPLDGELWLGRGRFEALSAIVRRAEPVDAEWRQLKYLVFELPGAPGSFAERAKRIREVVAAAGWEQLVAVEQAPAKDRAELQARLDGVVKEGGEGLMLHLAEAPYVTGRSDVLLKLKPLLDTEALVVAHVPGRGKYKGLLGALRVRTPEGREFLLGTGFSDEVRRNPPAVGATVTYAYRGLTRTGLPRFASFLRVREGF
jgi:DNA ligase-1